jgi:hypothetical protein
MYLLLLDEGDSAFSYQTLALNILSTFCGVPSLAADPKITNKVPAFIDIIANRYVTYHVMCLYERVH